jgi:UrcA family protein
MKKTNSIMLATASLGLFGSWGAVAQQAPATQKIEEITVEAPRTVTSERLPQGRGTQVTLAFTVNYADLDLRQTAGVRELEKRIGTAAADVCAQLETMYPAGQPTKDVCARRATDGAMVKAKKAIDAAVAAH